jgi:hypothetical protein
MELNIEMIYFPERNKDFTEGKCISTMFSKDNMLALLIARPYMMRSECEEATRLWVSSMLSENLLLLNQEAWAPEEGLLPHHTHAWSTYHCRSRVQTLHRLLF